MFAPCNFLVWLLSPISSLVLINLFRAGLVCSATFFYSSASILLLPEEKALEPKRMALSSGIRPLSSFVQLRQHTTASHRWTANRCNTILTASITTLAMPLIFNFIWKPNIVANVLSVQRDELPEVYYPAVAVLRMVDWTSQANLTLDSRPKCFVGWMGNDLPACDAVQTIGDRCNCTSNWDEAIVAFQWQNTTYRMLTWTPAKYMINKTPTVPLLLQAFFNYNSDKAFEDSFSHPSPSLWLAVWDANLSLQESLEYGYTRLKPFNALGESSISLGLRYREEPKKTSAYDYEFTPSTIPETKMTCDTSSDENYDPCHATINLQYPSFQRDVITIEAKMRWQDVAEAVGSWLSLFQVSSWMLSGLGWAV